VKFRPLLLTTAAVLALGASQVYAQYPPPAGNVVVSPAGPNPGVNGQTTFAVTVQSEAGAPAANVNCTASIASQPGSDASVFPTSFTTDGSGKANLTLKAGSSAGPVTVAVRCGELNATAVIAVGAGVPLPPDTGVGVSPAGDESGIEMSWVLAGGAIAAAAAGSLVLRRRLS
jgi:hypothetical protein